MNRTISGSFWISLYLVIVLLPIALMLVRPLPSGRSFLLEFSIALGFVGLTQIAIQFALIARFRRITAPYGIDIILQYHRQIAVVAVVLIFLHPVLIFIEQPYRLELLNPLRGNWASRFGLLSLLALLLIVGLSVWRKKIKLDYEVWRVTHALLAIAAIVFAQLHVSLAGLYINTVWKQVLWIGTSGIMVSLIVYLRLIKPLYLMKTKYRVAEVRRERGDTFTLALEPVGHSGMSFQPGQFAWIKVANNPYTIEEHPFSFSSSAERPGRLEFGIKALGDFTSKIMEIPTGTQAFVDGPHGAFSIDRYPSYSYAFYAGGVGITPILSTLRTMADRKDPRPVTLFYGAKTWEEASFREDIDALAKELNVNVVYVLEKPHEGWDGETGFITADLIGRHLPDDKVQRIHFICGPGVMMDAVYEALKERGVETEDIEMERFDLV